MRLFLTFVFLLTVGNARADELTAGDLYSFCVSNDKMVNTACRYYILGVVNGVRIGDSMYTGANRTFLKPGSQFGGCAVVDHQHRGPGTIKIVLRMLR